MRTLWYLCIFLTSLAVCSPAKGGAMHGDNNNPKNNTMKYAGKVNAPDFPEGAEWLNTGKPLSIRDVRGKVVLLDFWTYCCINCMHIIPDLKKLEEKYADELVVIGVHSAKFQTEKGTENIREAVLRYEIEHPVINDRDFRVWSEYGARAWPTVVLIDPDGKVIGSLSGEGIYEPLDNVIGEVVRDFDAVGKINRTPLQLVPEKSVRAQSLLSYPGKIIADEQSGMLFFTDSNHNRIVVATLDGEVREVIGSGAIGKRDGGYAEAEFFRPQGLAWDAKRKVLYVADTENHLIRKVDMQRETVETIAGTGEQARRFNVEGTGTDVALNSPWDVLLLGDTLYIAMAGPHQLWALDVATLEARVHAGTGREDIIDGALRSAALAQPSGIATDGMRLFFADSEVSAVRTASVDAGGRVETLLGEGLFEFGDIDGSYPKARLQHPLGVLYHEGVVYIADTYNHKIKALNPEGKTVHTVAGTGKRGFADGTARTAAFFEPSGLAIAHGKLYIADTNNDAIRVLDLATQDVSTLQFTHVEKLKMTVDKENYAERVELPEQRIAASASTIDVHIQLPKGTDFNREAPFFLAVRSQDEHVLAVRSLPDAAAETVRIPVQVAKGQTTVEVELSVYYCAKGKEGVCYVRDIAVRVPIVVGDTGSSAVAVECNLADMPQSMRHGL